jgi:hypothetical protein
VAAVDALGRFLRALGVESGRTPAGVDERASRYRTALAGRRMLVILDNAASAEQVRPLLPGGTGCMVLATSRDSLAGLVVADGAQRLALDVLTETESVHLLGTLGVGGPEHPAALARLCGGLPSALRVVGELATTHGDRALARLAADPATGAGRLLDAGDHPTLRSVLSWSYERLSPDAARLFRLLGTDPGPDSSTAAASSLAGVPLATGRQLLGELTRTYLVAEVSPGRYAEHPVVRAFARDRLRDDDAGDRDTARYRLLDHYAHSAVRAHQLLHPGCGPEPVAATPGTVVPELGSVTRARAWLDAERRTLPAAARLAWTHGCDSQARRLARVLACGASSPELTASIDFLSWPEDHPVPV